MEGGTKMGAMVGFGWSSGSGICFGVGVSLAGKVADMSATCRPDSQKSAHWPTGTRQADTNSFPTHFFVLGIADFLQIFSKYQRYIWSNHRTN